MGEYQQKVFDEAAKLVESMDVVVYIWWAQSLYCGTKKEMPLNYAASLEVPND